MKKIVSFSVCIYILSGLQMDMLLRIKKQKKDIKEEPAQMYMMTN